MSLCEGLFGGVFCFFMGILGRRLWVQDLELRDGTINRFQDLHIIPIIDFRIRKDLLGRVGNVSTVFD